MVDQYIVPGVTLIVLVMACVEYAKRAGLSGKQLLVASLLIGLVLGSLCQVLQETPTNWQGWAGAIIYGLMVGLTASGVYDAGVSIARKAALPSINYYNGSTADANSLVSQYMLNIDEINKRLDEIVNEINKPIEGNIQTSQTEPVYVGQELPADQTIVSAYPTYVDQSLPAGVDLGTTSATRDDSLPAQPNPAPVAPALSDNYIPPAPELKRSALFDAAQAFLASRGVANVTPAELERVVKEITG